MDTLDLHFNAGDALAASQLNEMVDGINESLTELPKMAKKDGYYENLGAGYAKSMLGTGASVPAELTRRTAGGTADIASGVASFKSIKGNTIVWNQLVGENTTEVTLVSGHKYYTHIGQTEEGVTTYIDSIVTGAGSAIAVSEGDMVFDLTKMTIASAINTPADFKALFPNDYYPYNASQLLSLTAQKFVTDGFNAFNVATGKAEVIGGLTPNAGQAGTYQITGTYTALSLDGETITPDTNGFFTPAKSGELSVTGGDNTTCVHLVWSGVRNGEFEPYWKSEKTLNLTTITGKLNGQGESVAIFPDGMRSAGTAHDELVRDASGNIVQAIKRIGEYVVTEQSEILILPYDCAAVRNIPNFAGGGLLTAKYKYDPNQGAGVPDKSISDSITSSTMWVKDSSLALSVEAYRAALLGEKIYYKLATPQIYVLDEPIDSNFRVDDFGTESIEPLTDAQGNPATAPFKAEIVYGPNVQDTIRRLPTNYLSITDYKTGIANLASALGTSLGKTIAIAWGGDNGSVPTFTITDNPTE